MKQRPDEAQNTIFSKYERSLLISQTSFEIFKFENGPPPVGAKTMLDFHVSLGFLASEYLAFIDDYFSFNKNAISQICPLVDIFEGHFQLTWVYHEKT